MVELEPDPNKEFEQASDLSSDDIEAVRDEVASRIEDAVSGGDDTEFEVFSEDGKMLDKSVSEVSVGEVVAYYPTDTEVFITGLGLDDPTEVEQYFNSGRGVGFRVVSE